MKKETVSLLLTLLLFAALIASLAFFTQENRRLYSENDVLEQVIKQDQFDLIGVKKEFEKTKNDLVVSQNETNGYKWMLEKANIPVDDYEASEDE